MAQPRAERGNAEAAAWEVIRSNDFAAALGAVQEAPKGIGDVAMGLAEMRVRASRLAHDVDKQAREALALVHGRLIREREAAQRHPTLHDTETDGRRDLHQEQTTACSKKTALPNAVVKQLQSLEVRLDSTVGHGSGPTER
ncbi:hypothetical protein ACFV80_45675 [Streptomyces sp. NPDC059862]|uniref:hypothetical protein n=1 Tax=Streptomyces sp. NPDC059862 TaxID=3346975 RepID=UPI0036586881